MKYLTVLRHAKSDWSSPGLDDHERPLNARGQLCAPAVARFLWRTYFDKEAAARMPAPETIVASTAVRTLGTARHVQEVMQLSPEALRLDSRLYLAAPDTVLEVVRGLDEAQRHAVIVGHNPGLHDFCNEMLSRSSIPRMPTCTAVIMGLPYEHWGMADWHEAQLIGYITPRALERTFPTEFSGISKLNGEED